MSRFDDEIWEAAGADPRPPAAHIAAFVRSLPETGRALDLGCGDGRLGKDLRAGEVVGADVSEAALRRAGGGVKLEPDEPLPFEDNSFDLVLCAETLEHVRDVQLLLSEARRVLKPGGLLAVTTPANRPLIRPEHPFSPHIRFFTSRSLQAALDATGFDIDSLEKRAGTLLAVARR